LILRIGIPRRFPRATRIGLCPRGAERASHVAPDRASDGRKGGPTCTPGGGVGDFVPAPSGSPIWHFAPHMRAFTLASPAQFRADGPPALASAAYAEAFQEVRQLGRLGGTALTPEHQDAARFAAALQVSIGDAILGCFDSKYHFDFWRPRTGISAAASDGNTATPAEDGWQPSLPTPNHPEYPSGHSCIAGALAEVVKDSFDTPQVYFEWSSNATGTARGYESVYEMIREIRNARAHGGMHYRFSSDDGVTLGRRTAHWVLANYFRPVARR
jgi:hypothetical protein